MSRRSLGVVDGIVLGGIVAGVLLRVWVLISSLGTLDGDEAVWGTMARRALSGDFSTFMWGQRYGGTQEVLLSTPFVAVLGPTPLAIRIVPIALWGVAAILVWRIGRRLLGDPAGRFAGVLFWIWPTYFVWKSTRAHGFYGSTLVLGLAIVLITLRLKERRSRSEFVLLGLALGCGLWASPQVAILAVPAVLWLLISEPRAVRGSWLVVPSACLGGLPWILANVRHNWSSLSAGVPRGDGIANLHNLVVATTPTALGLRVPFSLEWIGGRYVGPSLYVAVLVALLATIQRRRAMLALPILTIAIFPLLYYVSPFTWVNAEPRYLVMLSPVIALVAGSAMTTTRRGAAVLTCALAFSVIGFGIVEHGDLTAVRDDAEATAVPDDFGPLVGLLEAHGVTHVYATYWVAWRLTFETRERIIGATTTERGAVIRDGRVDPNDRKPGRYPPFYRSVHADRNAAHVFIVGGEHEARPETLLRRTGYRRVRTRGFDVYFAPRSPG